MVAVAEALVVDDLDARRQHHFSIQPEHQRFADLAAFRQPSYDLVGQRVPLAVRRRAAKRERRVAGGKKLSSCRLVARARRSDDKQQNQKYRFRA